MSFADVLNASCPTRVEEAKDENEWVECTMKKSRIGIIVGIVVVLLIVIILLIFAPMWLKIGGVVVGLLIVGGIAGTHYLWTPRVASAQYKAFERVIDLIARANPGLPRDQIKAQAIEQFRREGVQRSNISLLAPQPGATAPGVTASIASSATSALMPTVIDTFRTKPK